MANASKALLMAGGILISLVIIGVAVYMYNGILRAKQQEDESEYIKTITKINEQIEAFTGSSKIYGSELLSLCNLLEDYRHKYPADEGYTETELKVKINSDKVMGWNGLCGQFIKGTVLMDIYRTKESYVKEHGQYTYSSYPQIGNIEFLAGLQYNEYNSYNELELYLKKYGIVKTGTFGMFNDIMQRIEEYNAGKALITEFKNLRFKCNTVTYDPNNKVISYIEYETI